MQMGVFSQNVNRPVRMRLITCEFTYFVHIIDFNVHKCNYMVVSHLQYSLAHFVQFIMQVKFVILRTLYQNRYMRKMTI